MACLQVSGRLPRSVAPRRTSPQEDTSPPRRTAPPGGQEVAPPPLPPRRTALFGLHSLVFSGQRHSLQAAGGRQADLSAPPQDKHLDTPCLQAATQRRPEPSERGTAVICPIRPSAEKEGPRALGQQTPHLAPVGRAAGAGQGRLGSCLHPPAAGNSDSWRGHPPAGLTGPLGLPQAPRPMWLAAPSVLTLSPGQRSPQHKQ